MSFELRDGYKVSHCKQYPKGTELVYSNLTARGTRIEDQESTVFFGLQYFIKKYLIDGYNEFFAKPKEQVIWEFKQLMDNYLGVDAVRMRECEDLHDLGYLPICIKAVPEGTSVPLRVPMLTIYNTLPQFFWLTNALETILSTTMWLPITSATTAKRFKDLLDSWADKTGSKDFTPFQGHDFSMRGMQSLESGMMSGAAHLTSFVGTDTIPAITFLNKYYKGGDSPLVGCSVPATEHSVSSLNICALDSNSKLHAEQEFFKSLITQTYPSGIVSLVCDTYDFWSVVSEILPALKDTIMARDGKTVIRPDSGIPEDIICGNYVRGGSEKEAKNVEDKGLIECLWDIFGGTINAKGFKELDPHIGAIYGDAITYERANEISKRLAEKGFASTNIVYGIGSYTYGYVTRDTYNMAVKATYAIVNGKGVDIYKDPKTGDGMKKSLKGLVKVYNDHGIKVKDQVTWEEEGGLLETVFLDGKILREDSLEEIRQRIRGQ